MTATAPDTARPLPAVDIVVVSWNHGAWLPACLDSVARQRGPGFLLGRRVLVDNASASPLPPAVTSHPDVTLVANPENVGFAAACNQGAALGDGRYILFLNPDTRLATDALALAVARFESPGQADVAAVGLRLVNADGTTQRTCGRTPTAARLVCQTLGLSRLAPAWLPGLRLSAWAHDRSRDVDFACAAALLVRRDVFEALGGFDPRFFLYLEDADFSHRARRRGWRTVFCAEARAEHGWGWSVGGHRAWRLAHSWRSRVLFARLHASAPGRVAVTLVMLVLAPLPRLASALAARSGADAREVLRAWGQMVAMLVHEPARTTPRVSQTLPAPRGRQASALR